MFKLVRHFFAICAIVGCSEYETIGDVFILSRADFNQTIELAERGDADAAFRIYEHLSAGGNNYSNNAETASYWLEQAAEGGLTVVQQNLVTNYLIDKNADSCRNALAYVDRYELRSKVENREIQISQTDIRNCETIIAQAEAGNDHSAD